MHQMMKCGMHPLHKRKGRCGNRNTNPCWRCCGWGTYQSLLLARDLSKILKPDMFILQFCHNDYMNNLYEWERHSLHRNQFFRRPYGELVEGELQTFVPNSIYAKTYVL